jgi:hypothetical protein
MGLYSISIEHRLHGAIAAEVQAGETGSVDGGEAQHVFGKRRRLAPGMADIDGLRAAVDCRAGDAGGLLHARKVELRAGQPGEDRALVQATLGGDVTDVGLAGVTQDACEAGGQH